MKGADLPGLDERPELQPTLFSYVLTNSWRRQLVIVALSAASLPLLYLTLELPKQIVNRAIDGSDFPKTLFGHDFTQVEYLFLLSCAFLGLVIANNSVKYVINITKNLTGERLLQRLRAILLRKALAARLAERPKATPGEIIPTVTAEVQPIGYFIGEAFATPALQGGTLFVYFLFIFVQDWRLGLAAIALYPLQGYLIARLQKRVNLLSLERLKSTRRIADEYALSAAAIDDSDPGGRTRYLSSLDLLLQENFDIRYRLAQRKYVIKFLNNFLHQLTPFFFYAIGGYLVIAGTLSFGALVAVLAAYKDLLGPWKELLAFYQLSQDTRVKYAAMLEQFELGAADGKTEAPGTLTDPHPAE
ncbi:ABC transporter transmembrane domain-containing protein [Afifella pfennigii]|uniref:ABC transporter transmembrane domain-containing protein n=1 Tax=Afifella pfennigii TaxID=209897 RepID=UPI00047BDD91|nr:ABC transporter transmembrane domain-containing protein [Afifella pfennigii]